MFLKQFDLMLEPKALMHIVFCMPKLRFYLLVSFLCLSFTIHFQDGLALLWLSRKFITIPYVMVCNLYYI